MHRRLKRQSQPGDLAPGSNATTMNNDGQGLQEAFLETREYKRFAEFCDTCRHHRYIGLCHGFPGVGKTLSAWHFAQWQRIQPYFPERFYDFYRLTYIESAIVKAIAATRAPFPSQCFAPAGASCIPLQSPTPPQTG